MSIFDFLGGFMGLLDGVIAIVVGLAVIAYLWKLMMLIGSKDEGGKKDIRGAVAWGLVALLVMVTLWGIISVIEQNLFGGRINTLGI